MKTARNPTAFIACAAAAHLAFAQTPIRKADADGLPAIAQAKMADLKKFAQELDAAY